MTERRVIWGILILWTVFVLSVGSYAAYKLIAQIVPDKPKGVLTEKKVDTQYDKRLQENVGIAKSYWGAVCNNVVTVVRAPLAGRAGEAQYSNPPGNGPNESCTVIINSNRYFSDKVLCAIEVHEFGHLKGKGHSKNPRSVMYPRITKKNIPSLCKV